MAWRRHLTTAHPFLFVAFLTAWTIALLSPVPDQSARRVLGSAFWVFVFGKGLHVSGYAFLTVLGGSVRGWRPAWVLAGLVVHGGVTEYFQQFVGRTGSIRDVGLDAAGVLLGGLVLLAVRAARHRLVRQPGPAGDERIIG